VGEVEVEEVEGRVLVDLGAGDAAAEERVERGCQGLRVDKGSGR
jgi:hypothetical protein